MELNKWRVYLDGVLLKNAPLGLNKFTRDFIRDNELFGLYSINSFDLTFVGDGYCILKEFQDNFQSCQKEILIQKYCNHTWVEIFNGIIEVGSVEIDESLSQATCEIQDNSPLSLITKNSELLVDVETTKGIYGNTIVPAPFDTTLLKGINEVDYTPYSISWNDAFRVVLESITGVGVNVSSTYLDTASNESQIVIYFYGTLTDITSLELSYTNFQGETKVLNTTFSGYTAIEELANLCVNEISDGSTTQKKEFAILNEFDARGFSRFSIPSPVTPDRINLFSHLPIKINYLNIIASSSVTYAITYPSDLEIYGNMPRLCNYRALMGESSPYLLQYSFKELMNEFNKIYNVFFIATYNINGSIDFRLVTEQELNNSPVNYTFSNALGLKSKFDEENIFNKIITKDESNETLVQKERVFNNDFCGLGNELDLSSDWILGSVPTLTVLPQTYDEGLINNKYLISNSGGTTFYIVYYKVGVDIFSKQLFVTNKFETNWHKIYRHLSKFRSNIIGIANYYNPPINDFSINIENTSQNKLYKKYEFTEQMTNNDFNNLTDTIYDRVKFKISKETQYKEGLIMSVNYNYDTGEALFTVLGE